MIGHRSRLLPAFASLPLPRPAWNRGFLITESNEGRGIGSSSRPIANVRTVPLWAVATTHGIATISAAMTLQPELSGSGATVSAQAIANAATAGTRGIVRRMAIRWRVMGSCFEDGSQKKNSALVNSRQWFIQYSLVDRAGR